MRALRGVPPVELHEPFLKFVARPVDIDHEGDSEELLNRIRQLVRMGAVVQMRGLILPGRPGSPPGRNYIVRNLGRAAMTRSPVDGTLFFSPTRRGDFLEAARAANLPITFSVDPPPHDFRPYAHLWQTAYDPSVPIAPEKLARLHWVHGLGSCLAGLHLHGWICEDAHEGNFKGNYRAVKLVDFGGIDVVHCRVNTEWAAWTLLPLMEGFDSLDWRAFRSGYKERCVEARPQDGRSYAAEVFDRIEASDETGWGLAMDRGDFERALILLDDALLWLKDEDAERASTLKTNRAQCLSRLGFGEEAVAGYREVLANLRPDEDRSVVEFNLATALLRIYEFVEGAQILKALLLSATVSDELREAAQVLLVDINRMTDS